ncbi:MAG: GtrA family protein [Faecalibacterium sp.]
MLQWLKKNREVLLYLVFGVLTTLVNIFLYALFNVLFGYQAANSWGNILDNILCILFAYATNRAFVFASKSTGAAALREFTTFAACRLGTLVLDSAIMMIGGNLLAQPGTALVLAVLGRWADSTAARDLWGLGVKVTANAVVIVLNYVFSKFLVFRSKKT